jgi:hypothetical protein
MSGFDTQFCQIVQIKNQKNQMCESDGWFGVAHRPLRREPNSGVERAQFGRDRDSRIQLSETKQSLVQVD